MMTDLRVAFLSKLASSISNTDKPNKLLKSFYLMRCRELVKDPGLLQKYFPVECTCSYCGIEWTKGDCVINVKSKRSTKNQRRKTKSSKDVAKNRKSFKKEKAVVISNLLEKVCQLCKHSTFINLVKPDVTEINKKRKINMSESKRDSNDITIKTNHFIQNNRNNKRLKEEINVYSSTKDIFSLQNKNNSIIPNKSKVVKVNKKKKDKFAGLCKEAVLAMANSKKEKESSTVKDRLNLFLKPSN